MNQSSEKQRWIDVEAWYGYPRGYWLTYASGVLLVAALFVAAVENGHPAVYTFPVFAAYAIGWGHGIVMDSDPTEVE